MISGFGLSAFFFSTLAHTAFSDDTSSFLTVLALGTTAPMIIALFIVRIVPLEEEEEAEEAEYRVLGDEYIEGHSPLQRRLSEIERERLSSSIDTLNTALPQPSPHIRHPRRPRLSPASSSMEPPEFGSVVSLVSSPPLHPRLSLDLEDIPSEDESTSSRRQSPKYTERPTAPTDSLMGLLSAGDFWLLFAFISLCGLLSLYIRERSIDVVLSSIWYRANV